MIETLRRLVPPSVLAESGSVFYSGRAAFAAPSPLYILGLNPGGSPDRQARETVSRQMQEVLEEVPAAWSAYRDASWRGMPPGTCGLQPRVLHLIGALGLCPRLVPSSNVVFVRSAREHTLGHRFMDLADVIWPFHQHAIHQLQTRVVLCFGRTAGHYVARRLGATQPVAEFVEKNRRRWRSFSLSNRKGITVVTATHPSIADWTVAASDPTPLVRQALER